MQDPDLSRLLLYLLEEGGGRAVSDQVYLLFCP